jgi:hypothetical protein
MTAFSSIVAREFAVHARFPIVGEVVVSFPEDEVIQVDVDGLIFRMICGSDDDGFYFDCTNAVAAPVEFDYPLDLGELP